MEEKNPDSKKMESSTSTDIDGLVAKAKVMLETNGNPNPNPEDPIELGPRVISAGDIAKLIVERGRAARERWKERLKRPRKHPIKEGIKAFPKYKSRMEESLRLESQKKALQRVTDEDYLAAVDATSPDDYARGLERKKLKITRRFEVLQPLYEMLAKILDTFPIETEDQRERKMIAARKGMILIGQVRKGIITVDEARRKIEELRPT